MDHQLSGGETMAKHPLSAETPPTRPQRMQQQDSYTIHGLAHSLCPLSTTPISKGKSSSTAAEHNQGSNDDDDVEIPLPPPPSSSTRTTPSSSAHPTSKRKAQAISPVQDVATPEGQQPQRRKTVRELREDILARMRGARG